MRKLKMGVSTSYSQMAVGEESPGQCLGGLESSSVVSSTEEGMHSSLIEAFWEWMAVEMQLRFSAGWLSYFNQLQAITV